MEEGIDRVAQAGRAVLLKLLQPVYFNSSFIAQVDSDGPRRGAQELHQAPLFQFQSEGKRILWEFLSELVDAGAA
ncbi:MULTISPECIES: hypothetical protein [unclassified Streptomyces]|uniref:hypothetical protein n=1 Tax=unclassified Streptomyces TaxID=2593676 RepID=UPI003723811C